VKNSKGDSGEGIWDAWNQGCVGIKYGFLLGRVTVEFGQH
jgi:hypothetical protein